MSFSSLSLRPRTYTGMYVRLFIGALSIAIATNALVKKADVTRTEFQPYLSAVDEYRVHFDPRQKMSAKEIMDSLDNACDSGALLYTPDSATNKVNAIARKHICPELDKANWLR